eukprot:TRINITY_DN304_c0_g2_i8.p1 TRINITY_DN304_c0_g2~~TRINITY_DN304_c0_g2_i8.p1  ORF type:complete len:142 (+),score=18.16 TRINITY_DN304_c0_g2_i8:51-476(+)
MFSWFWSLLAWFWSLLRYFGFFRKRARVLLLGLDNAGKTTLLWMLKENRILVYPPTYIPYEVDLEMNDISFTFIDVAGDIRAQKSWLGLAEKADAIIYLVNSGESDRFDESYEVFQVSCLLDRFFVMIDIYLNMYEFANRI